MWMSASLIAIVALADPAAAGHLDDVRLPSPEEYPFEEEWQEACAIQFDDPRCYVYDLGADLHHAVLWARAELLLDVWETKWNPMYEESPLPKPADVRQLVCEADPAGEDGGFCIMSRDVEAAYWGSVPLVQKGSDVAWNLTVFAATHAGPLADDVQHAAENGTQEDVIWATQDVPAWLGEWRCHAEDACERPPLLPAPPPYP